MENSSAKVGCPGHFRKPVLLWRLLVLFIHIFIFVKLEAISVLSVKKASWHYNNFIKAFIAYRSFVLGFILGMEYHKETELKVSPFGKFLMAFGVKWKRGTSIRDEILRNNRFLHLNISNYNTYHVLHSTKYFFGKNNWTFHMTFFPLSIFLLLKTFLLTPFPHLFLVKPFIYV